MIAFAAEEKSLTLKDAIELYWQCDYAATQTIIGIEEAAACSFAFEKIKKEKFGGDFSKFMEWWKVNKATEYAKIIKKNG
jgi:hypothetical protein